MVLRGVSPPEYPVALSLHIDAHEAHCSLAVASCALHIPCHTAVGSEGLGVYSALRVQTVNPETSSVSDAHDEKEKK